ncbi:hypothetical protein Hanom_Chr00s034404g01771371 [Helianthus anomalus]
MKCLLDITRPKPGSILVILVYPLQEVMVLKRYFLQESKLRMLNLLALTMVKLRIHLQITSALLLHSIQRYLHSTQNCWIHNPIVQPSVPN